MVRKLRMMTIALALISSFLLAVSASAASFTDVPDTFWAQQSIEGLAQEGVLQGYPDNSYRPNKSVTRAELAVILKKVAGLKADGAAASIFADVETDKWYSESVEAVRDIMPGYQIGGLLYFKPEQEATREETIVAIMRLLGYDKAMIEDISNLQQFKDYDTISVTAKPVVSLAVAMGIIKGYPDETFRPHASLTRAAAAAMLWSMFDIAKQDIVEYPVSEQSSSKEPSSLRVSDETIPPDYLEKGSRFIVRGLVESNYAITSVVGGIFDDSENMVSGATVSLYSRSYDIKTGIDEDIRFDWLEEGAYIFRISAADESGNAKVLVEKRFTVGDSKKEEQKVPSSLRISGEIVPPDQLGKGSRFIVRGNVESNYTITSVTAGVFDGEENMVTGATASPYSQSYDIKAGLDAQIRFDWLADGIYSFRVSAADESGNALVLVDKHFTVGNGGKEEVKAPSSLRISGESAPPDQLGKGNRFIVQGTIESNYTITSATAGVFDESGNMVTGQSVSPNSKSYDVKAGLDKYVRFDWLAEGSYIFRISAADESGNVKALVEKRFIVGNGGKDNNSQALASIRTTAPATNNTNYYSNKNIFYASKYSPPFYYGGQQILGNCTWYAFGRIMEITGKAPGVHGNTNIFRGNAHTWWDRNIAAGKYSYGSEPRPGAIAVWGTDYPGGLGHVAVVEKIENGVVYISESGWISLEFRYIDIRKQGTKGFKGYIYVV